jgi:hypothetical protein
MLEILKIGSGDKEDIKRKHTCVRNTLAVCGKFRYHISIELVPYQIKKQTYIPSI